MFPFYSPDAGFLERIGSELSQDNRDVSRLQNGTLTEYSENPKGVQEGAVVGDSHQKLLVVLSNIGYCKDHIARELYQKYRHVWVQQRYFMVYFFRYKDKGQLMFGQ